MRGIDRIYPTLTLTLTLTLTCSRSYCQTRRFLLTLTLALTLTLTLTPVWCSGKCPDWLHCGQAFAWIRIPLRDPFLTKPDITLTLIGTSGV